MEHGDIAFGVAEDGGGLFDSRQQFIEPHPMLARHAQAHEMGHHAVGHEALDIGLGHPVAGRNDEPDTGPGRNLLVCHDASPCAVLFILRSIIQYARPC